MGGGSKAGKVSLWQQLAGASAAEWMLAAERQGDVVLQSFCRAHAAAAYRLEDAMEAAEPRPFGEPTQQESWGYDHCRCEGGA